ncbi:MAG: branched-chain amino acid ABC transporter substrate-binding protein [Nocardioidaceae bacterium]|nr:branched-chain amino acid ABC transporter substrate-binding protein [Nocardioidaceae bacterium]MCL2613640.1 branched-chain amino acid ABC transporter substrate-binding protein [Nocardioidaceae bacterium]
MTRTTKTVRLAAVAGIVALGLSACGTTGGSGSSGSSGSGSYTIAFLGAATGPEGALGQNMIGGIKTALAAYNKTNPKAKVSLKVYDSQGSASQATPLASSIVSNSSVIGLVGPGFSGESKAVNPRFAAAGLPEISPSATEIDLTHSGWKTFHRVVGSDQFQGAADAKYLTNNAKSKKVFVIDDSEAYGTGLAQVVQKSLPSSAVVGTDHVQVGQTDFSATVTKIKASGADSVFYGGYYAESGLLIKQLRNAGWNGVFVSGDGSEDPHFVTVAGAQAANGAVLTSAAGPATASFSKQYAAANGGQPAGLYSMQAYDATNIFLAGIKAGDTTRANLENFVNSYSGTGVIGPIKFDSNGDVTATTIYAYHVQNGKLDTEHPTPIK